MDTNKDGKVSKDEGLKAFLKSFYKAMPNASDEVTESVTAMFNKLFDKYDTSKDGFLEKSELKVIARHMYGY